MNGSNERMFDWIVLYWLRCVDYRTTISMNVSKVSEFSLCIHYISIPDVITDWYEFAGVENFI